VSAYGFLIIETEIGG